MDLYTRNALECSRITTKNYSTSFSLGVALLSKRFRLPVYAIYGFVRFADFIVDTFHEQDQAGLLADFQRQAYEAIERGHSSNPILHGFQWVVNQYGIERELIDAFLHSMAMDLEKNTYSPEEFKTYVYGSAEVVGLMCLRVFCQGQEGMYRDLLPSARKLGEAFQKVNFLRDMGSDMVERGRVYFPEADFRVFSTDTKTRIEEDIWADFRDALPGIRALPRDVRLGVYLAYRYYLELLKNIQKVPPDLLKAKRFRVPDRRKAVLLIKAYIRNQLGWM